MMLHGKNVLAVSSTVETITVNPVNISKEDKEKVARALSDIFETDYEKKMGHNASGRSLRHRLIKRLRFIRF